MIFPHAYVPNKILKSQRFLKDLAQTNPISKITIKPDHTVQPRLARQKLIRELEERKAVGEANLQIRDWKIVVNRN